MKNLAIQLASNNICISIQLLCLPCKFYPSVVKELGSGAFGLVNLAIWKDQQVAIKTLNSEATEREKVKFLQEAAIMGQFFHENVIKVLGIIMQEPVEIVIEYANKGDLHKFLIELKPE